MLELHIDAAGAPSIGLAREFPGHQETRVQGERSQPLTIVHGQDKGSSWTVPNASFGLV